MVQVRKLSKHFGRVQALRELTFELRRGEVLGFLGPNGAGKTTTLRLLTGYLRPTSGQALVAGYDVHEQSLEVRRQLGVVSEDTPLSPEMTPLEHLQFVAELRRIDPRAREQRIGDAVEVCGLFDVLTRATGELSKGLRQRVGLALALLHDPAILLLDEPTSGLDPNQIRELRELIRAIGRHKTVILSTHVLSEVQATCSRVLIISDGEIVADGEPHALAAQHAGASYQLLVEGGHEDGAAIVAALRGLPGVEQVALAPLVGAGAMPPRGAVSVSVRALPDRTDLRRELFCCARDHGWVLLELHRPPATLEDVFRRLTAD
ncbi:MAG: ATP-binding cassette domain-containing protein [Proteobacteria bacterium]|nr:ATP-binding cassette domain-containing protein [Pseudomonadota bacterium]